MPCNHLRGVSGFVFFDYGDIAVPKEKANYEPLTRFPEMVTRISIVE
jgi:hypothetical protein